MKRLSPQAKRKRLENKIMQIFQGEMKKLSKDIQKILADDLVTAFINRMAVFTEIQSKAGVSSPRKRSLNP
ncbi:MAG: hypothetical protein ACETVM_00240 [Candidatus Bathyarchaeia archaeon]